MKIQAFDRDTAKMISKRVEELLKPLDAEFGIVATIKGGTFSSGSFTAKVELSTRTADGAAVTKEGEAFKKYAALYGVKPEDLGRSVCIGDALYTLVGLNPRADRFPFVVRRSDGRTLKFTQGAVCKALGYPPSMLSPQNGA